MKNMRILTISTAMMIAAFGITTPSLADDEKFCNGPIITMNGNGEVESAPDIAEISLNVKSRAKTEADALELLSENMERVIKALDKMDVEDEDIRTDSVNVYPEYDHRNGREIIAYNGTSSIHFKTYDLKNITELLSGVMQGSSNMFSHINYSSSKEEELKDEARKDAFKKAYNKAKLYADLSGNDLGDICTISEGSVNSYIEPYRNNLGQERMIMADAAPAPQSNYSVPIKPGKIKTTAQITLVYMLED